ncbi:hypothetical protein MLD38_000942 [Melastoma candidum]|uniref:Uncharacterized protein n=1 Tax=Melastoma candidum TaxID=119954 RepID=A0ACB9SBQ0_9MYRT|nr:hypothetical protein MLD38_000942 [Melastoma candidum]
MRTRGRGLMPNKEEMKGAVECMNPKHTKEDVKRILEYAFTSQTVSNVMICCCGRARVQGRKLPIRLKTKSVY